jgi:predicted ATPase/class 3 adenylate cyclase
MPDLRTGPKAEAGAGLAIPVRRDLPTGTVTFVFTDIEGSTRLAGQLGTQRWGEVLTQHAAIIRSAAGEHEGVIVRTEGDSFFLAFRSARDAVAAAADAQRALVRQSWAHGASVKVRIGMHTGENAAPGTPENAADYVGYDVHHAARISAAGHGGQVLISSATRMLVGEQLPEGVTVRALGEHRLKDLSEPDELFQLVIAGLPDAFPALRTLSSVANNLPVQLTTFIGRRKELAAARALLERTRLLTLVGPGGTGKSRLSLELAAQMLDRFPDGVWQVRLAPVSEPGLFASVVAQALGLVVPAKVAPIDHVVDQLKGKEALLVLDNFEQIVAAAPDVGRILTECSRVKAIVTTRIVLRIAGEQEYPVPPLTLPDPEHVPDLEELSRAEAIQLFVERARAAQPDFMLTSDNARSVVGIVAQVDGLPLAIELAAARVKILPPQALLERLASGLGILQSSARDVPARQQTLRGAIAWSYDLLDPGLRRLFQRLSVFRGGAALQQIERVCGPAAEIDREVLDGVAELVDQSLLRRAAAGTEPRFVMLETIREYARERLDESAEAAATDLRHAQAYLALAQELATGLFGAHQKELLDRFDLEQGNLRVALDICSHPQCADRATCECTATEHAADDARVETSLRLVSALWRYWQMRGHLQEGRQRSERVLSLPGADRPGEAFLLALEAAGGIAYWQGDPVATERNYTRRLEVARATGDGLKLANALYDLSFVYIVPDRGPEIANGMLMLDEALRSFRAAGDRAGVAKTLWALSTTHFNRRDFVKAAEILDEVVATFRELENRFGLGWALHSLGVARLRLGALDQARAAFTEGLELFRAAGDLSGLVLFFFDFAELAAEQRRDERALRLFGAGQALKVRTGTQLADYLRQENAPFTLSVRALLERTEAATRDPLIREGEALSMEQAIELALAPEGS